MELLLQDDGNLVLLRHSTHGVHVEWESHTSGKGKNVILWLQEDGSLSLRNANTTEEYFSSYSGNIGQYPFRVEMPEVGWLKIVDKNGKAVWAADQTVAFCERSYKFTDGMCPDCHHKKTVKRCAQPGDKFESYGGSNGHFGMHTHYIKGYSYFINDDPAEYKLYRDRREYLLNYDQRH